MSTAADLVEFYDHLVPSFIKYNWSWIEYISQCGCVCCANTSCSAAELSALLTPS